MGPQITLALPQDVLGRVDAIAADYGKRRAEVLRMLIGAALKEHETKEEDVDIAAVEDEDLRHAARVITAWIAAADDGPARRERFKAYMQAADRPNRLRRFLGEASMGLIAEGRSVEEALVAPAEVEAMAAGGRDAGTRRSLLWFAVLAEMQERGVTVPKADASEPEEIPRFPDGDEEEG